MNHIKYRLFSILSLIAILILQVVWMANTFLIYTNQMQTTAATILTAYSESQLTFSQLAEKIDSELVRQGINCDHILIKTDTKTGGIVESSMPVNSPSIGSVASISIPYSHQSGCSVRLLFINVFFFIFSKIWVLILASIIASIAIVFGVIEQIRVIDEQQKLADIRNDFSYAMIHDMKSPLSSILMGIKALQSGKLDDKPKIKNEYFRIVKEEAQHLLALTNKLLTISKLENKRLIVFPVQIDLHDMLTDIIEKYKKKANKHLDAEYRLEVKTISADREYIKEVFINLIDNAVKYSKDSIRIEISSKTENNRNVVSIKDYGIGIVKADLPFVFNKFERGYMREHDSDKSISGFGLGLNYVYQVMKAHDGKVKVDSKENKYTQFDLYFSKLNP